MTTSAKRKREKTQTFSKAKLKVGKNRPKAANSTSTSFTSKSIVLKQQSLSSTDLTTSSLFKHNLSLLSSKSEAQRRDALTHLTSSILSAQPSTPLPQPASIVLSKAQPLLLDASTSIRVATLKLLRALPIKELGSLEQTLLYARAGMTHLSTEIRGSAVGVLEWLLEIAGESVVTMAGGWARLLRMFEAVLGWGEEEQEGKWKGGVKAGGKVGTGGKLLVGQLGALAKLLNAGFTEDVGDESAEEKKRARDFPICDGTVHCLPTRSNAFGYLNLYGTPREVEGEGYESVEERMEVFVELGMREKFGRGVREVKREGGEVGRAAAMVEKALKVVEERA